MILKMYKTHVFFVSSLILSYFVSYSFGAPVLAADEVEALKEIGKTLGKNWNFSVDPCSGELGWVTSNPIEGSENEVTCSCNYDNDTKCHVVRILLKSQNLPGILPPELVKLPYLQEIDLTRNYLNGSIPKEWGSMNLVYISLGGNRISGSLPIELANITTLKSFVLEFNFVTGVLPRELGNLSNIQRMILSSNYFSGPLPETLAKLTTLSDFRINDNHFSGKIPDFIQSCENITRLSMMGSGLEGPIPPGISFLTKLSDMRISDINSKEAIFPPLDNLKNMSVLVLRSCNITGEIPLYIGDMTNLQTLDLSFNKLTGHIPSNINSLRKANYIILAGNELTGSLPTMPKSADIDLSYNNLTFGSSTSTSCQENNINLFKSFSGENDLTGVLSCLRSSRCPSSSFNSFHINCGGREYTPNNTIYGEDTELSGSSKFFLSRYNWGFSSTGTYMENEFGMDKYTAENSYRLPLNDNELYKTARLSPLSLSYYGFCLHSGNYTVSLHFAEIMFTNDKTYGSLGRRIFDVYVQDFNIENAAGGVGIAIIKTFPAVVVGTTLEIRFHWAGKGTTGIPSKGTYGPLISAMSVEADFKLPPKDVPPKDGKKISRGTVVGILLSVVGGIGIVLGAMWRKGWFQRDEMDKELRGLDLQTGCFSLKQIKAATSNFDPKNKIGEGGFGPVYKGILEDGTIIAVKQLSSKSKQGSREFLNEIGMISALQHPNLVKLYGCCTEGNQLLLVYEYMENNNLAHALFDQKEGQLKLDWPTRHNICVGLARALTYLHEESRLKIVHRDIKATNVLLDKDLNTKVSDFGLAKLDEENDTHISTRIAGTYGYMAPEYAMRGHLTDKADVYSFGVVALEIVSGRTNTNYKAKEECVYLLDWVQHLHERGELLKLVDARMESNYVKEEVLDMIEVALQCTNTSPALRPTMSTVVSILEGRSSIEKIVSGTSMPTYDKKFKSSKEKYLLSEDQNTSEYQTQSTSIDVPWTGSSNSEDLYPANPNTEYWNIREQRSP